MIMVCTDCGSEINDDIHVIINCLCPSCNCNKTFVPKGLVSNNTIEGRMSTAQTIRDMISVNVMIKMAG